VRGGGGDGECYLIRKKKHAANIYRSIDFQNTALVDQILEFPSIKRPSDIVNSLLSQNYKWSINYV